MITIVAIGLAIGLVMALTGAGGGILAVPMLVFLVGLDLVQAAPIGLFAVGTSAALGAFLGLRTGLVRYRAALLMAVTGMLLSPVGVWLADHINTQLLNGLFATVLFFVAYRAFTQNHLPIDTHSPSFGSPLPCNLNAMKTRFIWTTRCARALASFGGLAGLLSGLLGVGGGFVMVPALQRFTDLQMQAVVATSLAVIALVSTTGVTAAAFSGKVDWMLAIPFCSGTLIGMVGGRLISSRLNNAFVQKSFASIALLVAIGMAAKSLG